MVEAGSLPEPQPEKAKRRRVVLETSKPTSIAEGGKNLLVTKVTLTRNPDGTITKKTQVRTEKDP